MSKNVKEIVCSFHNLYKATQVCRKNVRWKDSVAHFANHSLVSVYKLRKSLFNGEYQLSPYSVFTIKEPKERLITSTRFKDRVVQRSLCDNYLTEEITKDFIPENYACQKNKGTDKARERLELNLRNFYEKHGTNGYILKVDIHDYFGSTTHKVAIEATSKRVGDNWASEQVSTIINSFDNKGDKSKGIGLGSQVSQLIQPAILDNLDHYIKEVLQIKHYVRYMDDFILIHENKEFLHKCLRKIIKHLYKINLEISPKKTHILKITQPIRFLGFSFKLHDTGKITWKIYKDNLKQERRKLDKQWLRVSKGKMTTAEFDECYQSWRAFANKSDSRGRILKMDKYKRRLKNEKSFSSRTSH